MDVDVLVLQTAPQSLDEDIVESSTAAIHADPDIQLDQAAGENIARELRALIRVKYFRQAKRKRTVHDLKTKPGVLNI